MGFPCFKIAAILRKNIELKNLEQRYGHTWGTTCNLPEIYYVHKCAYISNYSALSLSQMSHTCDNVVKLSSSSICQESLWFIAMTLRIFITLVCWIDPKKCIVNLNAYYIKSIYLIYLVIKNYLWKFIYSNDLDKLIV